MWSVSNLSALNNVKQLARPNPAHHGSPYVAWGGPLLYQEVW
jgi:hypothetical protein